MLRSARHPRKIGWPLEHWSGCEVADDEAEDEDEIEVEVEIGAIK